MHEHFEDQTAQLGESYPHDGLNGNV
jgi:hypothetical protein